MATLQGNKPLGKEREGVIKQWTMDTYHHPGAFFFFRLFLFGVAQVKHEQRTLKFSLNCLSSFSVSSRFSSMMAPDHSSVCVQGGV